MSTRLSKSGQPVMGTVVEVLCVDERRPERGEFWIAGKVVGKMFGQGGSGHLIGLVVEVADDEGQVAHVHVPNNRDEEWRPFGGGA